MIINDVESVGLAKQGKQVNSMSSPSAGSAGSSADQISEASTTPSSAANSIEAMTNKIISAFESSTHSPMNSKKSAPEDVDEMKLLQMEALRAQIRASKAQENYYEKMGSSEKTL